MANDKNTDDDKKVMIVEDDPVIRMILRNIIQRNRPQVSVVECENGRVALDQMKNGFKLIFTDNNMPELSGLDFIRKIKDHPEYRSVPVVMVTVEAREEYKLLGEQIGLAGWVIKPFVVSEIFEYLNRFL